MYKKIGCVIDYDSLLSLEAWKELESIYATKNLIQINLQNTEIFPNLDLIITLGGDGIMLRTLHRYMSYNIPIYGVNRGSIGFLLNSYKPSEIFTSIASAKKIVLHPLQMTVWNEKGETFEALAVNEVSILRQTSQSAKIQLSINDKVRMSNLISDGLIVSTTAGSSAYNFAAHGPIIPLDANVLLVTPISPFRPRRWHGAIISRSSEILINILEHNKRPVSACADGKEFRDVVKIIVKESLKTKITLLFDHNESFEERVLQEQFRE